MECSKVLMQILMSTFSKYVFKVALKIRMTFCHTKLYTTKLALFCLLRYFSNDRNVLFFP